MKATEVIGREKDNRERKILFGLIEHYIRTGKPVGSNTLKESGFSDLSSATIRNYFAQLEEKGYLFQSHASGGRAPTLLAYQLYAQAYLQEDLEIDRKIIEPLTNFDSKEIAFFLQQSAETLSQISNCAVFLSAPRFDQDSIVDIKLLSLDASRCLGVLMTDFGVIQTEILTVIDKLTSFGIKRIENYFHWRLNGREQPKDLDDKELLLAQHFYNELMLRYIVSYSNFADEDVYRTGFSRLLTYADFQESSLLASGLALFENIKSIRLLLKEGKTLNRLKCWIGDDLKTYVSSIPPCAVCVIPYYINRSAVGAIGLLGPTRLPYRFLFQVLKLFSEEMSRILTKNIYKFKINYRLPEEPSLHWNKEERLLIERANLNLLT